MGDQGPEVTYSLKEVLTGMDAKLDIALKGLHAKADAQDVADLKARMVLVEVFMRQVEREAAAKIHNREWLWPVLLTAVVALLGVLQYFRL